jgi:hypothetical protein
MLHLKTIIIKDEKNTNSKRLFGERNINTAIKLEDLETATDKLNLKFLAL